MIIVSSEGICYGFYFTFIIIYKKYVWHFRFWHKDEFKIIESLYFLLFCCWNKCYWIEFDWFGYRQNSCFFTTVHISPHREGQLRGHCYQWQFQGNCHWQLDSKMVWLVDINSKLWYADHRWTSVWFLEASQYYNVQLGGQLCSGLL